MRRWQAAASATFVAVVLVVAAVGWQFPGLFAADARSIASSGIPELLPPDPAATPHPSGPLLLAGVATPLPREPLPSAAVATPLPREPLPSGAVAAPPPLDPRLAGVARSLVYESGPAVTVVWLTRDYLRIRPEAGMGFDPDIHLVFRVEVDPPVPDRSAKGLGSMLYLRDGGGKEYGVPAWAPVEDPRRVVGVAAFPRRDGRGNPVPALESRFMEVVVRGLEGVAKMEFRWELDRGERF